MRTAKISRKTTETNIELELSMDGNGKSNINTGIGFFNHMLTTFTKHSGFDLALKVEGDLDVDCHHTIEDTGIVLGTAINGALGSKKGIMRFGEARIPMDESLAEVSLDLGGRSYLLIDCEFMSQFVGEFDTQMTVHFFEAVATNAKMTMHAKVYGSNDHHKIEALFKGFAYALKRAVKIDGSEIKSTKGVI